MMYPNNKHQKVQVQPKWHKTAQIQEDHCKQHKNKTLPLTNTQTFSMNSEPKNEKKKQDTLLCNNRKAFNHRVAAGCCCCGASRALPTKKEEGRKEERGKQYQLPNTTLLYYYFPLSLLRRITKHLTTFWLFSCNKQAYVHHTSLIPVWAFTIMYLQLLVAFACWNK